MLQYLQLKNSCKAVKLLLGKKQTLLDKLYAPGIPKNFTVRELDSLMKKCNCEALEGGRGSSIKFYHIPTKRILQFDSPHPENTLYTYQIKKTREFLIAVGEYTIE